MKRSLVCAMSCLMLLSVMMLMPACDNSCAGDSQCSLGEVCHLGECVPAGSIDASVGGGGGMGGMGGSDDAGMGPPSTLPDCDAGESLKPTSMECRYLGSTVFEFRFGTASDNGECTVADPSLNFQPETCKSFQWVQSQEHSQISYDNGWYIISSENCPQNDGICEVGVSLDANPLALAAWNNQFAAGTKLASLKVVGNNANLDLPPLAGLPETVVLAAVKEDGFIVLLTGDDAVCETSYGCFPSP